MFGADFKDFSWFRFVRICVTYGGYPCKAFAVPATIGPGSRANAAAAAAVAGNAAARARPL